MHSIVALFLPLLAVANPLNKAKLVPRPSPLPDQIQILDLSTSGNGYLQGTVGTIMSPDRTVNIPTCKMTKLFCVTHAKSQVITFGFDTSQSYTGPNTAPAHSKNCQIHLGLKYPEEL